ncbi:hypothetical protein OSI29_10220, partial [Mycobacterium ulcerans]|nr:hypothetical protein [Mycobacterium ulcerans]MEB4027652.1 hypothetical protein [Mycobacterium ulcerans]MEB4044118.1 hypothetical protein [Mycobacterium ulcerans]MEB4093834.1 hypothetical protein [Mycobacterium ulcerans]MEB4151732.1 hypothetical protein [Mycobacterium ulcerans]
PPPRPPQSTIPQLTSLLINNAGALPWPPPRLPLAQKTCLSHLRCATDSVKHKSMSADIEKLD